MTETELKVMASAASVGESTIPRVGCSAPAAMGMHKPL
jgi:hypothetical protein